MGRSFDDPAIQPDIESWPFTVLKDNDLVKIEVDFKGQRKRYFPEEISAAILEKMKTTAELFLGVPIKDVVITCPAYFNNSQRQATKDAAGIAGLNVLRMINEPTAAAFAYGLSDNSSNQRRNALIFDFGGGTFDVSILAIIGKEYRVIATNGDTHLGGEDFDQRMVDFFVGEFRRKHNRDISKDKGLMRLLKSHCERAKRILSFANKAEFALEGSNLTGSISRARFEDLNDDLFQKSIDLVSDTLKEAKITKHVIDEVVLVGGSTRIPKIQEMLSKFFDGKALNHRVNPDEAVAMGAAIQAGLLQNELPDKLKGLKLSDVCPLSLGCEIFDGSVCVMIKRNTPIPTKVTSIFCTAHDNQTSVLTKVYEGERVMAKDNHLLGEFQIDNIPPMLRGKADIERTLEIDANGILTVTSYVPLSGSTSNLTIQNNSRFTKDVAQRLAAEAERFREEDLEHQKRLVVFNAFEKSVYDIKRQINSMEAGPVKHSAKFMIDQYVDFLEDNRDASKRVLEEKLEKLTNAWKHKNFTDL